MGKYVLTNPAPLVTLKWNPYQMAFLDALRLRYCPACGHSFSVQWGDVPSTFCPSCSTKGRRAYNVASLIAGRQGGKTRIATLAGALETTFPRSYGWICAPTFRDQEDFVKPAFFAQIPQGWLDDGDWSASDDIFTAPNGSRVAFRSLDNPEAVRGPTLDWLVMDEACKCSPVAFHVARPAMSINGGVIIPTTTPKGEDWVYEDVWVPAENGEPGFWAARYKSIDNPVQDPEFIESQRRTMSPELFAQEYEADFVTFQGAIYGDLVHRCVIDDVREETRAEALKQIREFLPEWPNVDASRTAIVGLDPGSDHPFAGCVAVATPKGLIVIGEYKKRKLPAMLHAQNLRVMVRGLTPRWLIDRSQAQMMIELAQHGIFATAAENNVTAGIERVKSWMISGQFKIIKSACPELVKELLSYRWAETDKADGSTGQQQPYKKRDDLADALRYMLMGWPHLPEAVKPTEGRDLSKMPEKMARDIARVMRGVQSQGKETIPDGSGDFYTSVENDGLEPMSVAAGGYDEFYG
jgi:hypothetical protein